MNFLRTLHSRKLLPILKLWASTWRVKRIGYDNVLNNLSKDPVFAFWHKDVIPLMFTHSELRMKIIVSPSKDGEILSAILEGLGHRTLKGSSRRLGARALLGAAKEGGLIGTAVDGPLGPALIVKPGIPFMARVRQSPIICGVCFVKGAVRLNTWDKMVVPLPFAKCSFAYSEPINTEGKATKELCNEIKKVLDHLEEIAKCS